MDQTWPSSLSVEARVTSIQEMMVRSHSNNTVVKSLPLNFSHFREIPHIDCPIRKKQEYYFLKKLETVVLRRLGIETQNFGFINLVNEVKWPP